MAGILAQKLGLSVIAGYIVGGAIVGPVMGLIDPSSEILRFLSELGIILIAFEIGLTVKMDFFSRGGVRAAGIVGTEILVVSLITYLLAFILSINWGSMLILIFMAVNTSTAVTFKMLEERRSDASRARSLILGVGAFEDIVAIFGLTLFPILAVIGLPSPARILSLIAGIAVSVALMIYLGLKVLTKPLEWLARTSEEIFLAIALAVILVYSYTAVLSGLSTALGAFIAGLVISNLKVSKMISEQLHSLRSISSLIFFSSIGASLPFVNEPVIILVAVTIALLVVAIKFLGFSLSAWVVGMRLEDSFHLGLYMLAISEFGVIIAKNAAEVGVVPQSFYLVSVLALASSALISSFLIKFENTIPLRAANVIPPRFRMAVERFSATLREAFKRQSPQLSEIKEAVWELVKRVALITLIVSAANTFFAYDKLIIPVNIKTHVESLLAVSIIIMMTLIILRMKRVVVKLGHSFAKTITHERPRIGEAIAGVIYASTLAGLALALTIVSLPQITSALNRILANETSSALTLTFLFILAILSVTYIKKAVERLEKVMEIPQ